MSCCSLLFLQRGSVALGGFWDFPVICSLPMRNAYFARCPDQKEHYHPNIWEKEWCDEGTCGHDRCPQKRPMANINASLRPDGGGTTCMRSGSPLNSIPPATRQHARMDRGTHVVERMPGGPRAAASRATASSKESKYAIMD